jgi:uncharacterized protein YqjF (DUF2071 family)
MNTNVKDLIPEESAVTNRSTIRLGLRADWRDMILVHFRFDPAVLQPHIPLPLDVHEGYAYVSLVYFTLNRMRPNGTGLLGQIAFRAISEHPFLNVRTYVRGPSGPGIFFVREWINNPLSRLLGPALYGLPYHAAKYLGMDGPGGTRTICVQNSSSGDELKILVPRTANEPHCAASGSLDEFLVERYVAYTYRAGTTRSFCVRHRPWRLENFDWFRVQLDLLEKTFPWFCHGHCIGAQRSNGFKDVFMSRPKKESEASRFLQNISDYAYS